MRQLRALSLACALALAGCATSTAPTGTAVPVVTASPTAPAFSDAQAGQAMVAARTGYGTALAAATAYGKLPTCSATQHAPCHDAALLRQLQKADAVAYAALDAADTILMQPALGTGARNSAVAAAQAALAAFVSLTGALK